MKKPVNSKQWTVDRKLQKLQWLVRAVTCHLSPVNFSVKPRSGFTLIEMMVAVSIFAIVMMVGVGALLSLIEANRRAQAINSVMNNLNAALESMTRSIRVGTTYYCQASATSPSPSVLENPQNCTDGTLLAFEASGGDSSDNTDQVVYRLNGIQLERSLDSGATWVALTAPEVSIDSFSFHVVGAQSFSEAADTIQPRVLMRIRGSAPVPGGTTDFNVQASVAQRILDI